MTHSSGPDLQRAENWGVGSVMVGSVFGALQTFTPNSPKHLRIRDLGLRINASAI